MIAFHKHPSRRDNLGFRYWRWTSLGRDYAVERSHWTGSAKLPDVWRALRRDGARWTIVSQHRTKRAAMEACHKDARRRQLQRSA